MGLLQADKLERQFQAYREAAPDIIIKALKLSEDKKIPFEQKLGQAQRIHIQQWLKGEGDPIPGIHARAFADASRIPMNDAQVSIAEMPEFGPRPADIREGFPEQAGMTEEEYKRIQEGNPPVIRPKFLADRAAALFRPKNWFSQKTGESIHMDVEGAFETMFGRLSTESVSATGLMAELEAMMSSLPVRGYEFSSSIQLFYINGQSVDEYLKDNKLQLTDQNRMTAVIRACSQARDRVEIGVVGTATVNGMEYLQQKVMEVRPDLSALDRLAGVFDKKRSKRASELYKDDPEKEERQNRIKTELGERIARAAEASPVGEPDPCGAA